MSFMNKEEYNLAEYYNFNPNTNYLNDHNILDNFTQTYPKNLFTGEDTDLFSVNFDEDHDDQYDSFLNSKFSLPCTNSQAAIGI